VLINLLFHIIERINSNLTDMFRINSDSKMISECSLVSPKKETYGTFSCINLHAGPCFTSRIALLSPVKSDPLTLYHWFRLVLQAAVIVSQFHCNFRLYPFICGGVREPEKGGQAELH
jgi:hypothetical protein